MDRCAVAEVLVESKLFGAFVRRMYVSETPSGALDVSIGMPDGRVIRAAGRHLLLPKVREYCMGPARVVQEL